MIAPPGYKLRKGILHRCVEEILSSHLVECTSRGTFKFDIGLNLLIHVQIASIIEEKGSPSGPADNELDFKSLSILDVSSNDLSSLDGVYSFPKLQALLVSHNQITQLSLVPHPFIVYHTWLTPCDMVPISNTFKDQFFKLPHYGFLFMATSMVPSPSCQSMTLRVMRHET